MDCRTTRVRPCDDHVMAKSLVTPVIPVKAQGWMSASHLSTTTMPARPHHEVLHPGMKRHPKFLVLLLHHIQREMHELGVGNEEPGHPTRLQIYREAFDFFIQEFKTYEPVLSEIRNEYEVALAKQGELVMQLEPLKSKNYISRYQSAQDVARMRQDMLEKLEILNVENRELRQERQSQKEEIDALTARLSNMAEELRKREAAIQSEELVRARLRELQHSAEIMEKDLRAALAAQETAVTELKSGMRSLRTELETSHELTSSLKAIVHRSVPKEDYDKAVALKLETEEKLKDTEDQIAALRHQAEELQQQKQHAAKVASRATDEYRMPNWDLIGMNCPPGSVREWALSCTGKDCNETIVFLIRQLILIKSSKDAPMTIRSDESHSQSTAKDDNYFVGLGVSSSVPKYLRYKGKVMNRRLSQTDLSFLINDIWTAKALHDASQKLRSPRIPLPDFLFSFLKKKFSTQEGVAEWGYNIFHAAKRFASSSVDCLVFYEILTAEMTEEMHHHLQNVVERTRSLFHKHDTLLNDGRAKGIIPKSEVSKILRLGWPHKSEGSLLQLQTALEADQPGEYFSYQWVFQASHESMFLEILKEQEVQARDAYIADLKKVLQAQSKDAKFPSTAILRGLATHDPGKSTVELEDYLCRGFQAASKDAIKPRTMIELDRFLANLRRAAVLYRSTEAPTSPSH
ncbi:hypothetical protein DFJ73DRAFT_833583 [Zopfochytrium polystomum]|nr:hypothetical protein DFJ73DRAFT_833583 [Zopfochytrium polystomum]